MLRFPTALFCVAIFIGCAEEPRLEPPRQTASNEAREIDSRHQSTRPAIKSDLLHFLQDGSQAAIEVSMPETLEASYANHVVIHSELLEVIFDFGVSSKSPDDEQHRFEVSHRIALSYFTAKRLFSALDMALERHEQAFG